MSVEFQQITLIYNLATRESITWGECGPRSENDWEPPLYKFICLFYFTVLGDVFRKKHFN